MSKFKTVARAGDLQPGDLKHIELDEETQICLTNVEGTIYAIGGECTHLGGPLGEGELNGKTIICPWHSAEFDATTGEATCPPAEDAEPVYAVRVVGDDIQVALPEAD